VLPLLIFYSYVNELLKFNIFLKNPKTKNPKKGVYWNYGIIGIIGIFDIIKRKQELKTHTGTG
jgi:hypothetical protein